MPARAASTQRSVAPSGAGSRARLAIRHALPARMRVIRFAAPRLGAASAGRGGTGGERMGPPQPGELRIQARASGTGRGPETLVFRGEVPQSEGQRMRCPLQAGESRGPVKYGYAVAGIVENGPAEW